MLLQKIRERLFSLRKKEESKKVIVYLLVLFSVAFFATRLPRLKNDIINPDGVNWHYRSEQFVVGLKYFQLEKTYQHYHPGVILMWITGPAVEIVKQISGVRVYDVSNFLDFELTAKFSLVIAQYFLSIFTIYWLSKITGFRKSILIVTIFTFEPFFLGNSRLYHLDVLVTLLLFISLIFAYLNLEKPNLKFSIVTGLFLSLSFLTKSISIGALLFVLFYYFSYFISTKNLKQNYKYLLFVLFSFIFFTFLLFPALLKNPVYYLTMIFKEADRVGIRKGHGQVILGEYTRNAGLLFYPLVILLKMSPLILSGALFALIYYLRSLKDIKKLFKSVKNKFLNFGLFITVFYLGYISFMTYPTKKIDRYAVVLFPFIAYLSAFGFLKIYDHMKNRWERFIFWVISSLIITSFWIVPIFKIFPFYFTYTNPAFGSSKKANEIIAQKPFGVGMVDLRDFIVERYVTSEDNYPKLGFLDIKPIRAIYPNTKVFDFRINGPGSYNLLVLGINEEMPEKVVDSKSHYFEKDYSIWINGLEYWRIYVRKDVVK